MPCARAHANPGVPIVARGFPGSSLSGTLLRVTGPLQSLVLRTEDVWQRYNQYTETFRGSQSGFPLLTPTMQAGQDSDGGGLGGLDGMCTLYAVVSQTLSLSR